MKNKIKIFAVSLLGALTIGSVASVPSVANARWEGFTATELQDFETIKVDGEKEAAWEVAKDIEISTVRKQYLFADSKSNPNPATGYINAMFNESKLYLYAEINDSTTDINNVQAWDAFTLNAYNSYKFNADHLDIYLDIKHDDPTNAALTWGSSYSNGGIAAAHFELAAGAGELKYSSDGTSGWLYEPNTDDRFTLAEYAVNNSTMYSKKTATGYVFEVEIDLSNAGVSDLLVGDAIGMYVGYYDRYETSSDNWGEQSVTTTAFEYNNYNPEKGPAYLPEINFVENPNSNFTASKISNEAQITADGVKDDIYNVSNSISINNITWRNENENPATAKMNLLWNTSFLYVFMEVKDDIHYGYQEGTWLEHRDAVEMILDLYHNTSYEGGYGGDYRGDKMCEGYYKIAAGVGQAAVDTTVQGTHWLWDDQKNNCSFASLKTETGYTVEYKIALGKDALEYMVIGREIGIGVKLYDKDADDKNGAVTTLQTKNDGQHNGPKYLSSVKLVHPLANVETKASLAFNYSYSVDTEGNYTHNYYDNLSIKYGVEADASLFDRTPTSAGVFIIPTANANDTIANMVANSTFTGKTICVSSNPTISNVNNKQVYSVGGTLNVVEENVELSEELKAILKTEVTAAVYFEFEDGTKVILQDKTYSVNSMTEKYLELDNLTESQKEAVKALNNYINS